MNLFFFTASGPEAQEHLKDTILDGFPIGDHISDLDTQIVQTLTDEGCLERVQMWGAIPGNQNLSRWNAIEPGDRVLVYWDGKFHFYGMIFAKTRNRSLAYAAWGSNGGKERGEIDHTWEYIYFIKNLTPVDIRFIDFAKLLSYATTFARGFTRVDTERINRVKDVFGNIDAAVAYLSNSELPKVINEFEKVVESQGERELEESLEGMSEDKFLEYLYKLNPDASIETIEGLKKIRKYNKKLIDDLKKLYSHSCQICGSSGLEKYGVSIVEGHHIVPFSLTQNNSPDNILILCPDHHRLIHKAKGKFEPERGEVQYANGFVEKLAIDLHIKQVRKNGKQ